MNRQKTSMDVLPCDPSRVDMRNSYWQPPSEWRTRREACHACGSGFTLTADEQRFWYEELRIPHVVQINCCPDCRKRRRIHRRIVGRLSRLLPRISRGEADDAERREAVFAIAEGMITRLATPRSLDVPILSTAAIAEKGAALIATLRRSSKAHDDLLPIQIMIQDRLQHQQRVEQLEGELRKSRQRSVVMDRAIRNVHAWLASPTKARSDQIIEPPRA